MRCRTHWTNCVWKSCHEEVVFLFRLQNCNLKKPQSAAWAVYSLGACGTEECPLFYPSVCSFAQCPWSVSRLPSQRRVKTNLALWWPAFVVLCTEHPADLWQSVTRNYKLQQKYFPFHQASCFFFDCVQCFEFIVFISPPSKLSSLSAVLVTSAGDQIHVRVWSSVVCRSKNQRMDHFCCVMSWFVDFFMRQLLNPLYPTDGGSAVVCP